MSTHDAIPARIPALSRVRAAVASRHDAYVRREIAERHDRHARHREVGGDFSVLP